MANYNTASSVILYNCKLNHNGLFVCDFGGSGASRDSIMGGTNGLATYKFGYSNCTYMRKDKVIVVDENADVLEAAGVNYCRYINPQFSSSMYFYAYVEQIEYVAPKTSRLHIRTDCFTTYFDKIDWGYQYIERHNRIIPFNAHFTPGTVNGGHFQTDFLSEGGYTAPRCMGQSTIPADFDFEAYDGTNDNGWVILNMSKDCFATDNEPNMSSISPAVSGLPQGSFWIAVEPTDLWLFTNIINGPQDMPARGGFTLQDVLAMYYVPRGCISADTDNPRWVVEEGAGANCPYFSFTIPHSWQGGTEYTVRLGASGGQTMFNGYKAYQGALLRYPYNFVKITDRAGHEWIFKPEMFQYNGGDLTIRYKKYFSIGDTVSMGIKITNYMDAECKEDICVFQTFPQIAATSDAYQQYLALNKNSLQNQYRWMGYDMALGVTQGTIKAAGGLMTDNPGSFVSGSAGLFGSVMNYERQNDALNARLTDMKSFPASVVCSGNGNLAMLMDSAGLFIELWSIDAAAAANIDELWDAMGYPCAILIPGNPWKDKAVYSYTKTKNCHVTGEIPESDRSTIDKLFDAGMTVWHTPSWYGRYDIVQNNPPA